MSAIRTVRAADGNFVMLTNAAGQDTRLSLQARGIIYYVLSLPPDTHLTATMIEAGGTNGRESVRSALKELEALGYYRRTRASVQGQWVWDQVISDSPFAKPQVEPCDGNPLYGNPAAGSPSAGNPADKDFKDGNPKDEDLKDEEPESLRDSSSGAAQPDPAEDDPPGLDAPGTREDVERVCGHLADRLEQRFGDRPSIGKRWRTAARLMLDGTPSVAAIPEVNIHRAIDWCQDNEFWQPNIQSVPKLREKYKQLRAQAQREQRQNGGAYKPPTSDVRVGMALDLAARYAEEEQAELGGGQPRQVTAGHVVSSETL